MIRSLVTHLRGSDLLTVCRADLVWLLQRAHGQAPDSEGMLDLLEAVPEPEPWRGSVNAMLQLDCCSRGLDKLQRRRAFMLLTKLLQENDDAQFRCRVLKSFEVLWRADEDPASNFNGAIRVLTAYSRSPAIGCHVRTLLSL